MSEGGGENSDQNRLLNSANSNNYDEENELEAQDGRSSSLNRSASSSRGGGGFRDLLKHLDRGFSGRRHSLKRPEIRDNSNRNTIVDNHHQLNHLNASDANDVLGDSAPPEWALLLLGCLLGLATGLFVAAFNRWVCSFLLMDLVLPVRLLSYVIIYDLSHVQSLSTCLSSNASVLTLFSINSFILH